MEKHISSKRLAIVGGIILRAPLFIPHGLSLDEKRRCDGIHWGQSKRKSFAVGKHARSLTLNLVVSIVDDLQLSEIMLGTSYLHELGIIHGDLKGVSVDNYDLIFRLAEYTIRQTFSLTTTVPPSLQTLVLQRFRLTSIQSLCPQL